MEECTGEAFLGGLPPGAKEILTSPPQMARLSWSTLSLVPVFLEWAPVCEIYLGCCEQLGSFMLTAG